jgi:hypothetical protein
MTKYFVSYHVVYNDGSWEIGNGVVGYALPIDNINNIRALELLIAKETKKLKTVYGRNGNSAGVAREVRSVFLINFVKVGEK